MEGADASDTQRNAATQRRERHDEDASVKTRLAVRATARKPRDSASDRDIRTPKRRLSRAHAIRNGVIAAAAAGATEDRRERRQEHERDHDREVLDDDPPDGDLPVCGFEESHVGQRPDEYDRAGDRDRETEHDPLRVGPSPERNNERGDGDGDEI